jgi:MoxR-like ATPase
MCQAVELDQSVQQKFNRTREELSSALVERDQEVDLLLTSLICKENPLLIGPPGTGYELVGASGFRNGEILLSSSR